MPVFGTPSIFKYQECFNPDWYVTNKSKICTGKWVFIVLMTFFLNLVLNSLTYLEVRIFTEYVIAYIQRINQLFLKDSCVRFCRLSLAQAVQIVGSNSPEMQLRFIPIQPEKRQSKMWNRFAFFHMPHKNMIYFVFSRTVHSCGHHKYFALSLGQTIRED